MKGFGVRRENGDGKFQVAVFNLSQQSSSNPLNLSFSTNFDNPRKSQANVG